MCLQSNINVLELDFIFQRNILPSLFAYLKATESILVLIVSLDNKMMILV